MSHEEEEVEQEEKDKNNLFINFLNTTPPPRSPHLELPICFHFNAFYVLYILHGSV